MTNSEIDILGIAALVISPKDMVRFEPYLRLEPVFTKILKDLTERHGIISYEIMKIEMQKIGIYDKVFLDSIYTRVREFIQYGFNEKLDDKINSILAELRYREYVSDVLMEIEYANSMIMEGKVVEAVVALKKLRAYNNQTSIGPVTSDLLIESCVKEDVFLTGIRELDRQVGGFLKGNMVTFYGGSGVQKTRFTIWLLVRILMQNPNFKALYFEKEMPLKDVGRMIISNIMQTDIREILSMFSVENEAKFQNLKSSLNVLLKGSDNRFLEALNRITFVPNDKFDNALHIYEIVERRQLHLTIIWKLYDKRKP